MTASLDLRADAARVSVTVPPVVGLAAGLAAAAVATWRGRMVNEYQSAGVFEALAVQLSAAGLPREDVTACQGFAVDERRHGVLCGAVATAFGGEAVAPCDKPAPWPSHPAVTAREGVLRNVMSVCCLSETVAVALIGAERLEMPAGPLRDLLTDIWSDEVGHARYGWRILARELPSLDTAARVRLGRYLTVALAHLDAHELAHLPLHGAPPPEGAALGLCNGADARTLYRETVDQVILPGLLALGIAPQTSPEP